MASFYSSAELRWFLPDSGRQWDRLLQWFSPAAPLLSHESERADDYLLFPDCNTVGVKRRQGKFEVKALVSPPRPVSLAKYGARGLTDQWTKWSFASQLQAQLESELAQAGPWCTVTKDRYLQKYSLESGRMSAVTPDARPDEGCNIELTRLSVKPANEWVTFGFEAFGPSGRVLATLDNAVEQFFAAHGAAPVELAGRDSRSYPAWLADVGN